MRITTSSLAALVLVGALPVAGQERFSISDFVTLPILGGARLSPDGTRLAYHRTVRDLETDKARRQIHLVDVKSGTTRQLTRKPGNSWGPVWAPRAEGLAFYSTRSGKARLYLNRFDGSDPELLVKDPVSHAVFSPEGKKIAFLAPPKKDPERPGFGKDPEVWTAIEDSTTWPQLWIFDRETKKRRQLTDGTAYIYDFDWHPDGTQLVYTFDPKGSEDLTEDHSLGIIELKGKAWTIGSGPVKYSHPRWSPDGNRLAFYRDRAEEMDVYLTVKDVWVMHRGAPVPPVNLTSKWNGSPTGRLASGGGDPLFWAPDGKSIWFVGAERANLNVYRVPADGSGKVEAVTQVEGEISRISFDASFRQMAFFWTDFARPADIFSRPTAPPSAEGSPPRQLTRVRDRVKRYGFRMPERLTWKSADGTEIEGFLFLPRGAKAGEPVPMMFDAHGGPAFRWGNAFSHRYMWHVFADHGFGSLIFNPRGSTGYGEKFQQGNFQGFGRGDFEDLMAGVDRLIEKGVTAPDRIGMTGYSYGGYLTNLAISRTTRFKAAVTIAGAFDFPSAMGQSNSILPRAYYRPLASEENMRRMYEHSPVARAMKVTTPTLLVHGKNDSAVHHMQAVEMFTMLQLVGVRSKLILYPGEGHGINRPTHMRHYLEQSVGWLQEHLPGWKEAGGAVLIESKKKDAPKKKEEKKAR